MTWKYNATLVVYVGYVVVGEHEDGGEDSGKLGATVGVTVGATVGATVGTIDGTVVDGVALTIERNRG